MRLRITSRACVVRVSDEQPVTELDLLPLPISIPSADLANYLSEALLDQGVVGGEVTIRRSEVDQVAVEVCFWTPTVLDVRFKAELLREVLSQWSDGLGEG